MYYCVPRYENTQVKRQSGASDACIHDLAPAVGGGTPAVGGIVELRTSPDAQRDQPAPGSSLPLPASVAVGLLVMGAGGLYVVRMRRG